MVIIPIGLDCFCLQKKGFFCSLYYFLEFLEKLLALQSWVIDVPVCKYTLKNDILMYQYAKYTLKN